MTPVESRNTQQRLDIQGLRGIAVLLVVLYHSGLPWIPGGYVGVDVFFVISGYLITGLLMRDFIEHRRIDYWRFLERRARRLLPAALVVITAVVVASSVVYPPLERADILSAARAAALYASNIWFAVRTTDYLAGEAAANPMLHMWSLAVEEQFYLLWPWLLALAVSKVAMQGVHRRALTIVVAISAISFLTCLAMTWIAQPWAFFGTPFRAWEFGAGAIVYLYTPHLRAIPTRVVHGAGIVGAMGVMASAVWMTDSTPFPGLWAMLPVAGTAIVLAALTADTPGMLRTMLSSRPLARIGDVSYSWYLWHWPLLVITPVLFPDTGLFVTMGAIVLSYLLAEISYRWIEIPFRQGFAMHTPARLVVASAMSVTVFAAVTLTIMMGTAINVPSSSKHQLLNAARNDLPDLYRDGCHAAISHVEPTECVSGAIGSPDVVVLFGDSHAAHWQPALAELSEEYGWKLVSITKSGCPAIDATVNLDSHRRVYHECTKWRAAAMLRITTLRPNMVIMGNSSRYAEMSPVEWEYAARRTISSITATGSKAILIRDTPWPGFDVPTCLARLVHRGIEISSACQYSRASGLLGGQRLFEAEVRAVSTSRSAANIDLTDVICPTDRCSPLTADLVHFSDDNHLTATYSRHLAEAMNAALRKMSQK